jgi:hypothetical protein
VALAGGAAGEEHGGIRGGRRAKCDEEKAKVKFALTMEAAQGILTVRKPWARRWAAVDRGPWARWQSVGDGAVRCSLTGWAGTAPMGQTHLPFSFIYFFSNKFQSSGFKNTNHFLTQLQKFQTLAS